MDIGCNCISVIFEEWKARQHGYSKRRTWKKLHIGIDAQIGEIILAELTSNGKDSGHDGYDGIDFKGVSY